MLDLDLDLDLDRDRDRDLDLEARPSRAPRRALTLVLVLCVLPVLLSLAPLSARADETARIESGRIVLSSPLAFESHGGMLLPTDAPILDAVAALLRAHPTMTIEIGAHTDARGSDAYNMQMTEHVAGEVRMALIARGIAAARLVARGYGETQPIADNATESGRAANRRIELTILHP